MQLQWHSTTKYSIPYTRGYSYVPNKSACTFIYGKAYLVGSIEVRAQNLLEINVHARLFGTLEYPLSLPLTQPLYLHRLAAVVEIPPLFFPIVLTSEDG